MPIELDTNYNNDAKIKVVGVGGGGGNAINNMIDSGLTGVDFIVVNTDKQALEHNKAETKIQLGKGLGAGARPEVGKKSLEDKIDDVREIIKGSDMVFITAGMGGGTGTGGAPVIAKLAREMNALVVGIVTKPFSWEGKRRIAAAEQGIQELKDNVDALIVIENERLLSIIEEKTGFKEAFKMVDSVLYDATRGISDIISCHGVINVDFADVVTIMKGMGDALMGIGTASGDNRAAVATKNALNSPMLDGLSIKGSQGVLVNISGGKDMTMQEIALAVSIIEEEAGEDVNLIHGVVQNDDEMDEISVTVVATGFKKVEKVEPKPEVLPGEIEIVSTLPTHGQQITIPGTSINETSTTTTPPTRPFQPTRGIFGGGISTSFNTDRLSAGRPKGIDELDKYNTPAFLRKGTIIQDARLQNASVEKHF